MQLIISQSAVQAYLGIELLLFFVIVCVLKLMYDCITFSPVFSKTMVQNFISIGGKMENLW